MERHQVRILLLGPSQPVKCRAGRLSSRERLNNIPPFGGEPDETGMSGGADLAQLHAFSRMKTVMLTVRQ